MKESFAAPLVQQCLNILKREDIKIEFKKLFQPLIQCVLYELNHYIYIIVILVFLIFIMILTNLIILIMIMRNNKIFFKF